MALRHYIMGNLGIVHCERQTVFIRQPSVISKIMVLNHGINFKDGSKHIV
jgi:hypothetical protein